MDLASIINRANQLNPNNLRYWKSRGYLGRPEDWAVLVGGSYFPVVKWLEAISNIKAVIIWTKQSSKSITCFHGIAKGFCYLCTLKGAVIFVTASSIALIYWYYPKELKGYAMNSWNMTGDLYRTSAHFINNNLNIVGQYEKYFISSHIWHYGVVMPYRTVKVGVVYTVLGLRNLATRIGYYCNPYDEFPKNDD